MRLLKMILKATGQKGVPQGGVISPVLSNLYLNEVDRMLERAIKATRFKQYTAVQYARFADDLVILVDAHPRHDWLVAAVTKRLREEIGKLRVEINEENSRIVDLRKGGSFGFRGFRMVVVGEAEVGSDGDQPNVCQLRVTSVSFDGFSPDCVFLGTPVIICILSRLFSNRLGAQIGYGNLPSEFWSSYHLFPRQEKAIDVFRHSPGTIRCRAGESSCYDRHAY